MTAAQFLLNIFFAALSAFMGVLLGVWWAKRQWAEEREAQRGLLRTHLIQAFRFNLDRLEQSLKYLEQATPVIPNFRLDTATVTYVLLTGRGLFEDESLFDRFSWQRYQLEHINAKLDYLHGSLTPGGINQTGLALSRYESLVQHMKVTRKDISKLLDDYERIA